jgi:hypothetical protein
MRCAEVTGIGDKFIADVVTGEPPPFNPSMVTARLAAVRGSKSSTWGANVCGGVADQARSGSAHNFIAKLEPLESAQVNQARLATRRAIQEAVEDSPMSRRFIVAMLGLGLALILMPQVSLAAEDHIAEAITHTKQAIDHGKMGHADVLTTHAEAALTHAQAGEKAKANPHCKEAIKHLEQAIDEGKKGHADAATTHAKAALTHLEQIK